MSPMTGITTWTRVHLVMIVPRQTIIYSLKAKEVLGFSNPDGQTYNVCPEPLGFTR